MSAKNFSINSTCKACGIRFNDDWPKLVVLKPCNHLCHEECATTGSKCQICGTDVVETLHEHNIVKDCQDAINVASVKKCSYVPTFFDYLRLLWRIPVIVYQFGLLYKDYRFNSVTYETIKRRLRSIHKVLNINITVNGLEKINDSEPKMYVCNHVSYHDALILPRYMRAGILSSKGGMSSTFARVLGAGFNVLMIDRGTSKNTVSQMNDFVKQKNDSLFIFAQGMLGSYRTLTKFRTGSFATNYNVQPIVLRYKQDVSSMSFFHILCFPSVDIELTVLDVVPKSESSTAEEYCERVRHLMAESGGFRLSEVDSHDVKETVHDTASPLVE